MNSSRFQYYLAQIDFETGHQCAAGRAPNQSSDDALRRLGFSDEQIATLERISRSQRTSMLAEEAILLAVNAVALGINIKRLEHTISCLSLLVDNWHNLELAYSIADTLGGQATAELAIVTARGSFKIARLLIENSEELHQWADSIGIGAEVAAFHADLVDAIATCGLSIALSGLAWAGVKWMNSGPEKTLSKLEVTSRPVKELHARLATGCLPADVRKVLPNVPAVVAQAY